MAKKTQTGRPEITLYQEDFYAAEEVKEETVQLVVFRLADEWYGLEIADSKQVTRIDKITDLPFGPDHIAGIVSLRGDILSVTDLRKILGLAQQEVTDRSRLVVIESGPLETGLWVDEVQAIIVVPVSRIDPTLATIPPERAGYVKGTCRSGDKLIGILDTRKIFRLGREENPAATGSMK